MCLAEENFMQNNQNNKKNILIYIMFALIIAILLAGIVYQFICIKTLQAQLDGMTGANILVNINKIAFKI